jgi:hypothetical protein
MHNIKNISYIAIKENLIDDLYYKTFYITYFVKYDNSILLRGFEFIIKCLLWFLTFFFEIKISLLYYLPYNIHNYIVDNQIKGLTFEVIHSIDSWKSYTSTKNICFRYTENHILDEFILDKNNNLTADQNIFFNELCDDINNESFTNNIKNNIINIKDRYTIWELSFYGKEGYNTLSNPINII